MKRYIFLLIIGFITLFFYHFLNIREPLNVNTDKVLKIQLIEPPAGGDAGDDAADYAIDAAKNCKYLMRQIDNSTTGLVSYNTQLIEAQQKMDTINQLITANTKSINYNEEVMKAFIKEQQKGAQDTAAQFDTIKMPTTFSGGHPLPKGTGGAAGFGAGAGNLMLVTKQLIQLVSKFIKNI